MSVLNLTQIKGYLPHRYPFLLVDRVEEVVLGERIRAIKAVSGNEAFLQGHFPGNPVVPGVLQIEAMGQAGVLLAILSGAKVDKDHSMYVGAITDCRFKLMIGPGDVMELRAEVLKQKLGIWKLKCEVHIEGQLASTATVTAMSGPTAKMPQLPPEYPPPMFEDVP